MEKLHESQYCGVPVNIFDAVTTIREAIAQAEVTATLLCVLSLDFREAFDRISHRYLFAVLEKYGISDGDINAIRTCMLRLHYQYKSTGIYLGQYPSNVRYDRNVQ
jgi:hypothetical protein